MQTVTETNILHAIREINSNTFELEGTITAVDYYMSQKFTEAERAALTCTWSDSENGRIKARYTKDTPLCPDCNVTMHPLVTPRMWVRQSFQCPKCLEAYNVLGPGESSANQQTLP